MVFPRANLAMEKEDVKQAFQGSYGEVLMNLKISSEIVLEVCSLAREKGIPVVLDADSVRDFNFSRLKGLEIISSNETECRYITGLPCGTEAEAAAASRRIAEICQARFVVIKMGKRGALLYRIEEDQTNFGPACPVQAVDTTVAGDAFTAVMTAEYLRHGDLKRAIGYANALGALAVTRLEAQPSVSSAQEVEVFFDKVGHPKEVFALEQRPVSIRFYRLCPNRSDPAER